MVSQTNEQALESAIEKHLTGTCLEDLKNGVKEVIPNFNNKHFELGYPSDFDMQYAIDKKFFGNFHRQPKKKN